MSDRLSVNRTESTIAERAFVLADRLGLKLNTVRVRDAGPVHAALGVGYVAGILTVSRRAAEELNDAELDFAMTFAMAITPGVMILYMALVQAVCITAMVLLGRQLGWHWMVGAGIGFAIGLVAVTMTSYFNLRNEQRKRLRKAIKVTDDHESARSYLVKFAEANAAVIRGKGPEMMRRALLEDFDEASRALR